jgi:hypothetical protein
MENEMNKNKWMVGIALLGIAGIAGLYLASKSDGNGGGGLGEGIGQTIMGSPGGLTAKGQAVSAKVAARQAAGFIQYTGVGEALTAEKIGVSQIPAGKKAAKVTEAQVSFIPSVSAVGAHIPGTMYNPRAGYMPIAGTAPAVGKKGVLPTVRPSQFTGASREITRGEAIALGIPSTQLTAKGIATKKKVVARQASGFTQFSGKTPSSGYAAASARGND